MARQDEISSTKRLLDLIRSRSGSEADNPDPAPAAASGGALKSSFQKIIQFKKKMVVGVDIGLRSLRLVAINHSAEKKKELIDYSVLPFEPELKKDAVQFSRFIKSALATFCGSSRTVEIWSAISSADVETRYIKIPKVPSKQIHNAVYWTYKKEVSFNEKTDLFDFEVLGEITIDGVRRIEVICYSAPMHEIQELKHLFVRSGYPLAGISIVPFAIQNLLRAQWLDPEAKNLCNLFIGKDWSRIAVFSEGNLVLSRDIKAGIISMIEAIREEAGLRLEDERQRIAADETARGETAEADTAIEGGAAGKLFGLLIQNASGVRIELEGIQYRPEDIFKMVEAALERVVRQVERTIQHYNLNFKRESVEKIFVSGRVCGNQQIVDYIGSQLDLPIEVIDPFQTASASLENVTVPRTLEEKGRFLPAIGMALADNSITPNFIHTQKEKQQLATVLMFNRVIFGFIVLLLATCIGFNYWQGHLLKLKKNVQAGLQRQVDSAAPQIDKYLIVQMVAKKQQNIRTLQDLGHRYMGAAVIGEVSDMTPDDVRLISLTIDLGGPDAAKADTRQATPKKNKMMILEGIVVGDRLGLESALANYLVKLSQTPIVSGARIQSKSMGLFGKTEGLRFTAQLDLV